MKTLKRMMKSFLAGSVSLLVSTHVWAQEDQTFYGLINCKMDNLYENLKEVAYIIIPPIVLLIGIIYSIRRKKGSKRRWRPLIIAVIVMILLIAAIAAFDYYLMGTGGNGYQGEC